MTAHVLGYLNLKRLTVQSTGDYEEKLELADTTDGNVKSYNQLGK